VLWLKEWDIEGFEYVAREQLKLFSVKPVSTENKISEKQVLIDCDYLQLEHTEDVVQAMIKIYNDATIEATNYFEESDHFIYITPKNFENLIANYFFIYCKRKSEYTSKYNKV